MRQIPSNLTNQRLWCMMRPHDLGLVGRQQLGVQICAVCSYQLPHVWWQRICVKRNHWNFWPKLLLLRYTVILQLPLCHSFYMFLLSSSTMFYYIVQSSKIIESCNISTYIIYPNFPCCPGTTGFLWVNSGRRKRHLPPSPSTVWRWWRRQLLHRRLDEASKPAQSGLNWGSYCCIMIVYNCV